ncbi:hypothetical protein Tco_1063514 [Tanacetum coccineum]
MQVNVQFLQQLQPEWSRFVTVVKQSKEIDTISYHTLFDILKQYQKENQFASYQTTKAKRVAKPVTPPSSSVSEEDSDPELKLTGIRGKPPVWQSGSADRKRIHSFNCKRDVDLYAKECTEPADWLADTDEEMMNYNMEAHYSIHGKDSRGEVSGRQLLSGIVSLIGNSEQTNEFEKYKAL